MRQKILHVFLLVCFTGSIALAQVDTVLTKLQDQKNFFALKEGFLKKGFSQKDVNYWYFNAVLANVFNHPKESGDYTEKALSKFAAKLQNADKVKLKLLQVDNYVKSYQYKKAYQTSEEVFSKYDTLIAAPLLKSYKNSNRIWKALQNTPPQHVKITKDVQLELKKDLVGMHLPVKMGDSTYHFIFDTGANISTITESYAQKLGVTILGDSVEVGSISRQVVMSKVGVAPTLHIGDIELSNVVFLVFPDQALYIPQIKYQINGIIGFPVLEQLKELHIQRESGHLMIPKTPANKNLNNFALDGLKPMVAIQFNGTTNAYRFDSGATKSTLYKPFYDAYGDALKNSLTAKEIKLTGAGGGSTYKGFSLPQLNFTIGEQAVTLKDAEIVAEPTNNLGIVQYGNIGQDVIKQFKTVILNFDSMYIDLSNN